MIVTKLHSSRVVGSINLLDWHSTHKITLTSTKRVSKFKIGLLCFLIEMPFFGISFTCKTFDHKMNNQIKPNQTKPNQNPTKPNQAKPRVIQKLEILYNNFTSNSFIITFHNASITNTFPTL